MTAAERALLQEAKQWLRGRSGFTGVTLGHKETGGRLTPERSLVFSVPRKRPIEAVAVADRIPSRFGAVRTDVREAVIHAPRTLQPVAFTERLRPCPPGQSIGHEDITAGTLGGFVRRGSEPGWCVLSNAHVLADSGAAQIGDPILQPGPADRGGPGDVYTTLAEYAGLHFLGESDPGGGKKNSVLARGYWSAARAVVHAAPRLVGCPYRLQVSPRRVEQPSPNLIDAAVSRPVEDAWVDLETPGIGVAQGVRDFLLGELARKRGRTTETTILRCEGEDALVRVQYGGERIAEFDHQSMFVARDGGAGSAGGDSGSWIFHDPDLFVGALLFAGGGGQTYGNRMSDVFSILGLRLS